MSTIKVSEHTISQALATAIFNDDYSGLSASDEHYISQWLKGYITLNSDDPPFFSTTLGREYSSVAETFGWSFEDQMAITRTAIEAAFCEPATKNRLLVRLDSATQENGDN